MSEETRKKLDKINKFLFCEVKVLNKPNPFEDDETPEVTTKTDKTPVYKRYEQLIVDMDNATKMLIKIAAKAGEIADWQKEFTPEQINTMSKDEKNQYKNRALKLSENYWEANSFEPRKMYEKIKIEFDSDADMKYVKQALDFQASHGNELSSALLANCKKLVDLGDFTGTLNIPIKLSLPSSTRFAEESENDGYMKIECNTSDYQKDEKSFKLNANLGLSGLIKLFSFGLKGGVTVEKDSQDTQFEKVLIEFEVCLVNIIRPWMDATLFSKYILWDAGGDQMKGSVSSGKKSQQTDDHLLPYIPMQMIVARNVKLIADWNEEHKSFVKNAVKAGLSIGWGPFKIAPSADVSSSHFKEDTKTGKSYLNCPGMQCIGFISWVPPFSAPQDGESQSPKLDKGSIHGKESYAESANYLVSQYSLPPNMRAILKPDKATVH